jgi:hypothetical protein
MGWSGGSSGGRGRSPSSRWISRRTAGSGTGLTTDDPSPAAPERTWPTMCQRPQRCGGSERSVQGRRACGPRPQAGGHAAVVASSGSEIGATTLRRAEMLAVQQGAGDISRECVWWSSRRPPRAA